MVFSPFLSFNLCDCKRLSKLWDGINSSITYAHSPVSSIYVAIVVFFPYSYPKQKKVCDIWFRSKTSPIDPVPLSAKSLTWKGIQIEFHYHVSSKCFLMLWHLLLLQRRSSSALCASSHLRADLGRLNQPNYFQGEKCSILHDSK